LWCDRCKKEIGGESYTIAAMGLCRDCTIEIGKMVTAYFKEIYGEPDKVMEEEYKHIEQKGEKGCGNDGKL